MFFKQTNPLNLSKNKIIKPTGQITDHCKIEYNHLNLFILLLIKIIFKDLKVQNQWLVQMNKNTKVKLKYWDQLTNLNMISQENFKRKSQISKYKTINSNKV
jgi:hypothetical protein